jgi:hypothetical protein
MIKPVGHQGADARTNTHEPNGQIYFEKVYFKPEQGPAK